MNTSTSPLTSRRWRSIVTRGACLVVVAGLGVVSSVSGHAAGPPGASCPPDAARRWQVPQIAVADLPYTADAAEAWLTPDINITDLPRTADAMEHWICRP
jgi:hypothetical protein